MKWFEPTEEQVVAWREWLDGRPDYVRQVAQRFDPWTMYRLTSTGQRCAFRGCDVGALTCSQSRCPDDACRLPAGHEGAHAAIGNVTVRIYAEHPDLGEISAVEVFGIGADELTPWPDEPGDPKVS